MSIYEEFKYFEKYFKCFRFDVCIFIFNLLNINLKSIWRNANQILPQRRDSFFSYNIQQVLLAYRESLFETRNILST